MRCARRLVRIVPLITVMLAGCAMGAIRPPTPATHLNIDPHTPSPPGEHFYVLIFGAQRNFRSPTYAHTFVTVVHTAEPEPGQCKILDVHTLSWLPATLKIRLLAHHPEPGVNLTLKEALAFAHANRERVSLWGPYECRLSYYTRFVVQKHFMETSGIGYQCNDNQGEAARVGNGSNCIHAITDADPQFGRRNYPLFWFGDPASEHVANRLRERGSISDPVTVHDEVLAALGLGGCPLRRRHFDDRLIDFPRVQPAELLFGGRWRHGPRQAPPYDVPPFPPPGPHGTWDEQPGK